MHVLKKYKAVLLSGLLVVVFCVAAYCAVGRADSAESHTYAEHIFQDDTVNEINIEIDEADWQDMLENPLEEEYHKANITINGETVGNVAIRTKGNNSLTSVASSDSDRYSFKIDFDYYDDNSNYYGLKKLCLNNNYSDNSSMREYISYKIMGELGLDVPQCGYSNITVNGEEWGLYLAVEAIDETFLETHFDDATGDLYKPEGQDGTGADLVYDGDDVDGRTGTDPKANGKIVRLHPADVLHIPGLGFDGLVGYSPIAMAKNAIGLAIAAEEYGSKFYANGAAPSGVLEHPGTLKDPGRVRESWQSTFGGSSNANKVAVLEEGMKYTPISIAPNEAQFLETRKFQIDEIARIFRVPPHMVGDLDKSSFSNIEQQSLEFVKYTLDPWVSRWEQAMVRALLSAEEKKKYFFKFNVDGLLRGDYQSRMTGYATARQNGWMSANDIRELENMDRIPEELGGDLYLINGNMTKLQDAGIFAGSGKGKDTGEEVLELEKESGKFGKRTGS